MDPRLQQIEELKRQMEALQREVKGKAPAPPTTGPVVRRRPQMIAVFSYKGGVGKSTTFINLAATLAGMGRKTLVVDCDTQCNTSSFFRRHGLDVEPDTEPEPVVIDDPAADDDSDDDEDDPFPHAAGASVELGPPADDFGPQDRVDTVHVWYKDDVPHLMDVEERVHTPACNIHSALAPAFMVLGEANKQNDGAFGQFKDKGVWKDIELQRISYKPAENPPENPVVAASGGGRRRKAKGKAGVVEGTGTLPSDPDMLWLLPGSPHLLRHEHNMSINEHSNISVPYFAAFRRLIHLIAEKEEDKGKKPFEYVIVDFGPSCTLLNKAFIMSCDFILPPVFCDSFSFESVHGFLYELLPDSKDESGRPVDGWLNWAKKRRRAVPSDASELHRFNPTAPRILPFLITAFGVRGNNGTALQKQYARWAATLTDYVARTPAPARDCFILKDTKEMTSCFLSNLNSLMPVSHGIRMPLVYLNKPAIRAYATRMNQKDNGVGVMKSVLYVRKQYINLAQFIIVRCRPVGGVSAAAALPVAGDGGAGSSGAGPAAPQPARGPSRGAAGGGGAGAGSRAAGGGRAKRART